MREFTCGQRSIPFPLTLRCCIFLFPQEVLLALLRSFATSSTLCHAVGAWRHHVRPRLPQGFRRPSPLCSARQRLGIACMVGLSLRLHRVLRRLADPARSFHSLRCTCHLHRFICRDRQGSFA